VNGSSAFGHEAHLAGAAATGPEKSLIRMLIAQWCRPLRRQHSGRFSAAPDEASGAISGKLNAARSSQLSARQIRGMSSDHETATNNLLSCGKLSHPE